MKFHILPMEPFEERYTSQWLRWWPEDLDYYGHECNLILGDCQKTERYKGEFADNFSTWQWKGSQIANLAKVFVQGAVRSGDVILSLEGWNPTVTAAAYMRDTSGIDAKIVIFVHAGTYDPWDYLKIVGMERWSSYVEKGWFEAADLILVGSEFHRQLLSSERRISSSKIFVCGVPIKRSCLPIGALPWKERPMLVVFPHRLSSSKAPWEFDDIEKIYTKEFGDKLLGREVTWVKTRDVRWKGTTFDGYSSKEKYYELLSQARVVVSTARQETFGIAMQEGIALGAWAVAPFRLSYPETIPQHAGSLFSTLEEAAYQIYEKLCKPESPRWDGYHEGAIYRAIREIVGRFSKEATPPYPVGETR